MEAPEARSRVIAATALAGAAHLLLDLLATRLRVTAPPYLLLDHAGDLFRELLARDRSTILAGVSLASAGVNGTIAALLGVATSELRRRVLWLGVVLSAVWVFSGGLMILVYMSAAPPWVIVGSLAAGIPRSFAVAWVLDRVLPRPSPVLG